MKKIKNKRILCPICGSQNLIDHNSPGEVGGLYCRDCHSDFYKKDAKIE
jgi:ribosomal protein S27AE